MKIVINALAYKAESSGIGVMIRELLGLYTRITDKPCRVIVPSNAPEFPGGERTEVIRAPWKYEQGIRRMFFQTFQMGRQYCRDAILLTTDSKTPFFLPKSCILIPIITDLAVFRIPEVYQLSRVFWWRLQYKYLRRRANRLIAVSESTKRDIVELLKVHPDKITVIPCACSERMRPVTDAEKLKELRKTYDLPERYILFVGNFNPRKNILRIMAAFDRLKEETNLPHGLVIAGGQGWKFNKEEALKGIRHSGDIRFTGFVPDEDMPALYSAADLFVFPTLYEGFGVPVLEAQRCGTPVLTSDGSSLPEVAGDGAVFADPYSVEDIYRQMREVLTDDSLRSALIKRGTENARRFSWELSAGRLDEFVERQILNNGSETACGEDRNRQTGKA